jgi:hypothetical protein
MRVAKLWQEHPYMAWPGQMQATAEGIAFSNEGISSQVKWTTFRHYLESNTVFLLFLSPLNFYLVPKRAFADAEQLNQFRALLGNIRRQAPSAPPIPEPQ